MAELCFPLLAMWCVAQIKMNEREHVCQLMYQRYQEAVRVQVGVHAYPVVWFVCGRVAVVAQYAFTLMREREVHRMRLEIWRYKFEGASW